MKEVYSVLMLIVILGVTSCNSDIRYKKTKSGLQYHFFDENKSGKEGKIKDIYSLNTTLKNDQNDQILQEFVMFERYQSVYPGDIHEGLSLLHEGDSVVFRLNADSFFTHHGIQKPKSITKPNEMILFHVGVLKILSPFEHLLEMNEKEVIDMEQFIQRKGWKVKTDSTGIQYEITKPNPTGHDIQIGDTVLVTYLYYTLLENILAKSKENDTWRFVVGDESRIPGLSRILTFMRKGEEIRAVLPFGEAFGAEGMGVQILPYTTIIIELETHDVKPK